MRLDIEKALQYRVVMLSGDEDALRLQTLPKLIEAASAGDDFDLETYSAEAAPPHEWFASAGTAPFLSPRRTVVVRSLLRCDDAASLASAKLPDSALLILVADEEQGDDSKQRRLKSIRSQWEKSVGSTGGLVLSFTLGPTGVKDELKEAAKALGKNLSGPVVDLLLEMCGSSLSRALGELEKLAVYSGDAPQIRESDVKAVVVPSREWNVFRLVDAIVGREPGAALRQMKILVGSTSKPEELIFRSILPQLSKQLRVIWQARLCVEAGCTPMNAPGHVRALFPEKYALHKEKDWVQQKAMNAAKRVNLDVLSRCLAILADADSRMKGILTGFSHSETMERMILEMDSAVRSAQRTQTR